MTSGILKIVDVKFKREFVDDNTTRIRAIVTANIAGDDMNRWLEKSAQERATLIEQNEELCRANVALKVQRADVKTQADRKRITQRFAAEDKNFFQTDGRGDSIRN